MAMTPPSHLHMHKFQGNPATRWLHQSLFRLGPEPESSESLQLVSKKAKDLTLICHRALTSPAALNRPPISTRGWGCTENSQDEVLLWTREEIKFLWWLSCHVVADCTFPRFSAPHPGPSSATPLKSTGSFPPDLPHSPYR